MIETLAAILIVVGVAFLVIAAVGVFRLGDPFLRMHASTKAGTLGAGLVAIAVALTAPDWTTATSALLTVAILLVTLPVASHLLGRATYVSGAPFDGEGERDALAGVLKRASEPLEERLFARQGAARATAADGVAPGDTPARAAGAAGGLRPRKLDQLLVAALDRVPAETMPRWQALAAAEGVEPTLIAFCDQALLDEAPDRESRDTALAEERAQLSALVQRCETAASGAPALAVQYAEGDPFALLGRLGTAAGLLVLPVEGWFSHGASLPAASRARSSDRLLAFAESYPGHTLFVPAEVRPVTRVVAVDDGSAGFLANLLFAVDKRLWGDAEIVVVGAGPGPERADARRTEVEAALAGTGARWRFSREGETQAAVAAGAEAAILTRLGKPSGAEPSGGAWQDRVAPGWRGEALIG